MAFSRKTWVPGDKWNLASANDLEGRIETATVGGGGSVSDSSATVKGITKVSTTPVSPTNPIAVGDNDPRVVGGQAAGTASIRTLGTGSTEAAAGNHAHAASAVTFTPNGSIAATNVQAAIQEVRDEATGTPAASAVTFTPNGSIAATNVQAAIQEVRDEAASGGSTVRTTGMWVDFWRIAFDSTPVFSNYAQTAARFRYVALNAWERTHLASLLAADPTITGMMYQNWIYERPRLAGGTLNTDDAATAVSREEAEWASSGSNSGEDWYMRTLSTLTGVTGAASTDIFTKTAHGLQAGYAVSFSGMTGGAGLSASPAVYYVISANLTANTFQVSTSIGGSAATFTTDLTALTALNVSAYVLNPFNGSDRMLDVGKAAVQASMVNNVVTRAKRTSAKFGAVFADDFNYDTAVTSASIPYSTDDQWMIRGLSPSAYRAGGPIRQEGLMLVPNFAAAGAYPNLIDLLPGIDGYCDEFWTRYSGGGWNGYWYHSLLMAEKAVAMGKIAFLSTPGSTNTDTTAMRSGLAAALLATDTVDPSRVAFAFTGIDHTNEKWDTGTFGMDIGAPSGARAWTGTANASCLIRYFTDGVVVFNPGYNPGSPYGAGTLRTGTTVVSLTGGPYTGPGPASGTLTSVTSVTLSPGEAVILDKD